MHTRMIAWLACNEDSRPTVIDARGFAPRTMEVRFGDHKTDKFNIYIHIDAARHLCEQLSTMIQAIEDETPLPPERDMPVFTGSNLA